MIQFAVVIEKIIQIAVKVGPKLLKIAQQVIKFAPKVLAYIAEISALLDILKPNENMEDVGAKATNAEKGRDDFETTEDYKSYLDEEVQVDEAYMDALSEEDRKAFACVGAAIALEIICEKLGVETDIEFWEIASKSGLSVEEIKAVVKVIDDKNVDFDHLKKFSEQKLQGKDNGDLYDALFDAFKGLTPNVSDEVIEDKIEKMQG